MRSEAERLHDTVYSRAQALLHILDRHHVDLGTVRMGDAVSELDGWRWDVTVGADVVYSFRATTMPDQLALIGRWNVAGLVAAGLIDVAAKVNVLRERRTN